MRSDVFMFLLALTEGRTRGPRHSQETRVKLWHVSKDADTCGQYTALQDASVTKPSSLCDTYEAKQTNRFCVCITKDSLSSGNVQWKHKCGICEMKWMPNHHNRKEKDRRAQRIKHWGNMKRFERMRRERKRNKEEARQVNRRQRRRGLKYLHDGSSKPKTK